MKIEFFMFTIICLFFNKNYILHYVLLSRYKHKVQLEIGIMTQKNIHIKAHENEEKYYIEFECLISLELKIFQILVPLREMFFDRNSISY